MKPLFFLGLGMCFLGGCIIRHEEDHAGSGGYGGGSAGTYNLTEPQMAESLQQRKIQNILRTGAKIVVTTNPGCIMQIRAGLEKSGIRVLHIADYLADSLTPKNLI